MRRAELLQHFRERIYGQPLPAPTAIRFAVTATDFASVTRKIVTITITGPHGSRSFKVRLFIPRATAAPPAVFLLIDHRSDVTDDPAQNTQFFPVLDITRRGYAIAAFDVAEVAPDDPATYRMGIIDLFHAARSPLPDSAGRAISAWAWAASRAMDYLVTDGAVDGKRVAIVGHSRGGKTSLLAGAQDPRFALVIANDSGTAGAKLARRAHDGQTIRGINRAFPHWFCGNYWDYGGNEHLLPVDQHALIALAAPRAVYIESATDSPSSDQKGQFLGHVGAMPAYALYGLRSTGLVEGDWPPATDTAYHGRAMGYHLRRGGHNLLKADWRLFMDFADLNLSASPRTVVVEASDPPAAKSTDPHAMLRWSTASNGTLGNLQANAAGDYVTYAIPDLRAGVTYDVAVRARKTSDAGIFKIYVQDELSGAGSQRGAASGYDRYTSSAFLANLSRFAYTPLTSGTHYMQFRVSGRNPANLTGFYRVSIDHITLTPR